MALNDYKITESQMTTSGVVAAPDRLLGTAAENKAIFDRLIREAVRPDYNALIDELEAPTAAGNLGAMTRVGDASTIQEELFKVSNLEGVTATPEEINVLDGSAATTEDLNKLHGITATAAQMNQTVADSHTHGNKELLDTYTQTNASLSNAIAMSHSHANKTLLDTLTTDPYSYADNAAADAAQTLESDIREHFLPFTGGTMSGALSMGDKKITNLAPPEQATDAANRKYVDDAIGSSGALPPGGTTGQVLKKNSDANYDVGWGSGGGGGGGDDKADKKVPSAANNVALLDVTGNLADSGKQLTADAIGAIAAQKTGVGYKPDADIWIGQHRIGFAGPSEEGLYLLATRGPEQVGSDIIPPRLELQETLDNRACLLGNIAEPEVDSDAANKKYVDDAVGSGTSAAKLTTPRTIDGVEFDGTAAICHYADCTSSATAATKVVTIKGDGSFALVDGARVVVLFRYGNTSSTIALNVNATGAKTAYWPNGAGNVSATATAKIFPYAAIAFVYDASGRWYVETQGRYAGIHTLTASGWVANAIYGGYTQAVTLSSLQTADYPQISLEQSNDATAAALQRGEVVKITRCIPQVSSLLFLCADSPPDIDLTLNVEIRRG